MAKQPWTTAGVAAKQSELNALSQQALSAQATLIRNNLPGWVNDNFTLTTAQQTYLAGMDSRLIQYASGLIGFAVDLKLPVTLTQNPPTNTFKIVYIDNNIHTENTATGLVTSGGVTITEIYR